MGAVQHDAASVREPDVAGDSALGEDESADGIAPADVEERRIAALMAAQIVGREVDAARAAVIVDGEIDEALVAAAHDMALNELRFQQAVAALAWHVIDPVLGEEHVTRQKAKRPVGTPVQARHHDGAVLVPVAGKQVALQRFEQKSGNSQRPAAAHRDFSHRITLRSLCRGVSRPAVSLRLDRRETCTAARVGMAPGTLSASGAGKV